MNYKTSIYGVTTTNQSIIYQLQCHPTKPWVWGKGLSTIGVCSQASSVPSCHVLNDVCWLQGWGLTVWHDSQMGSNNRILRWFRKSRENIDASQYGYHPAARTWAFMALKQETTNLRPVTLETHPCRLKLDLSDCCWCQWFAMVETTAWLAIQLLVFDQRWFFLDGVHGKRNVELWLIILD